MRPLDGIKVLELGQLIAGPFTTKILAEFGAEVIKIEPPLSGDPLRKWRLLHEGTSVWWASQSRNKKSVTVNLRSPEGQAIIRRLVKEVDILVENFRPGALESWGLDEDTLKSINPALIMVRISGYGQTGPYRDRPGFGVVGEAMAGFRHLSGEPGRPPVRVGISIGDSLAALHAVIGALMALRHREVQQGGGQVVDVALYESVFNMMESLVAEYAHFGEVRQPAGSSLPGITPSNAYLCADGKYALIAGNGDSIFKRLMLLIGRPDMAEDPAFAHNDGRVAEAEYIDGVIAQWAAQHSLDEVLQALHEHRVPAGRVYDVADIFKDPHYQAREMLIQGELEDGTAVTLPGILPKLSKTPGGVERKAPTLGQDTDEVLLSLGFDQATLHQLREQGVI
ncbi:Succinyl-CoA--L-malate CoA-transferase beta subunit [Oligella urethralis]|uniref:Bile acid-CoA hydrolase n=2 Tax=Alcaligenaceae TaxID=506 RepID=A0A2N6QB61_9BURK|nr:formyl-CoA transferase [Oligella urethralis]WOS37369.1 Succinyl-CoA--L-malate CoA-transferase beta subunit [Oligella urethralis]SPY08351.1 Bile acid-CoA hydrolase [Oligella urethralis]SUA55580.1 Bile acid-CoA hydrolase [Oligella urethralis]SUA58877.1 Bile acid-CoA hydrolase [Oligella urethralis]